MVGTSAVEQTNVVANRARHLIFFEENGLAYNYKTNQWTRLPAYSGLGMFSVNSETSDIGLIINSSGSIDLQEQVNTFAVQTALIETGAVDLNQGGRSVIHGIRPRVSGGTTTVRAGVQDAIAGAVSYSSATTPNSRTNMANFRSEGRYLRAEFTVTGAFTTIFGADVDFAPQGRV